MTFTVIPLSQLNPSGLDRLAALHGAVMHTLLAELGLPVVRRYYQACKEDPSVIGFCAYASSSEIIGWAVGSPHPGELNARLRRPLARFAAQMLRLAVTRPGVLWQLVTSVRSSSSLMESEPGTVELTYIGVTPPARGQGLGKALLAAFTDASRSAGYRSVVLSVETDNPEAVALYTRAGFQVTKTFTEGRFQRQRMALDL